MTSWVLDIHDINAGSPRLASAPIMDMSFGYVINGPGGFEATIPLGHSAATKLNFKVGARELRVKRNGVLVWGGYLWGTRVDLASPNPPSLVIRGEGYSSRLRSRFVMSDLRYDDVAQHTIARNLVTHTQAQGSGDLGISTGGSHTGGSVVRDRSYCLADHENIYESIDELVEMDDGIDWEIGPAPDFATDKQMRTHQPRKGTNKTGSVTVNQAEASTIGYEESGDAVISRMITIGGGGDCNPAEADASDSTALSDYGLMQGIDSIESDRLIDVTRYNAEQLRLRKVPQFTAQILVHESNFAWGDLVVGDTFTISSNRGPAGGFANFTQTARLLAFDVTVASREITFYQLSCDSVIS